MWFGFQGLRAVGAVLPLPAVRVLGRVLGSVAYGLLRAQRRLAHQHLAYGLGQTVSAAQRRRIARGVFRHLGQTAMEWLALPALSPQTLKQVVVGEGIAHVRQALAKGNGAIVVTAHLGNWELIPLYLRSLGFTGGVLARRLRYPEYEAFLIGLRGARGVPTFARGSVKEVARLLRANQIVGMLPDQDVDSLEGVFVDFFGHPAYTPVGPAALSLMTGAPILPCFAVRDGRRFRIVVEPPVAVDRAADRSQAVVTLTQAWTRVVESYIRRYPDQWVWMHRRWKTQPGDSPEERGRWRAPASQRGAAPSRPDEHPAPDEGTGRSAGGPPAPPGTTRATGSGARAAKVVGIRDEGWPSSGALWARLRQTTAAALVGLLGLGCGGGVAGCGRTTASGAAARQSAPGDPAVATSPDGAAPDVTPPENGGDAPDGGRGGPPPARGTPPENGGDAPEGGRGGPPPARGPAAEADAGQQMSEFALTGYATDGTKRWEVAGRGAGLEGDIVTIRQPDAVGYEPERTASLTASVAHIRQTDRTIRMEHAVTVHTSDGLWLMAPLLYWLPDREEMVTDSPVRIETDHMLVRGRGLSGLTQLKQATIGSDITLVLNPGDEDVSGARRHVTITCDGPLAFDYERSIATFHQNVHVQDPNGELYTDTLIAYLDRATHTIRYAEAIGQVRIHQQQHIAHSERAVYEPTRGTITLVGRPSLVLYPSETDQPPPAFGFPGGLAAQPAEPDRQAAAAGAGAPPPLQDDGGPSLARGRAESP
jgi:KDO2-lipid IV(A) lauroyltransferase